ncbi:MFS transporter [Erythrobacter alti]|uniref:MFS transporter n=1 Tax=Erythrobacter alti TaxID=1896145 RepID=UPI0030F483A9
MPAAALSAKQEWKRYGLLVMAAGIGFSFASLMTPAVGLFMGPLQDEFGWSRTLLSSGSLIGAAISLLLSPLFGALIDRFGSRRLALGGLFGTSLAIASFSLMRGAEYEWLLIWFAYGLVSMTIHATTWTTAVASVFKSSRGLALGVTLAGSALASAIVAPLTNWLIEDFGWRAAYVALGTGWGAIAIVLCLFFLFDARDEQRLLLKVNKEKAAEAPNLPGLTISQAWRDSSLWRVAIATLLTLSITIGITVHQVPIIVDAGFSRTNAAWLASMAGIAGIIGKLVTGTLIDRYHVRWVGGLTLASTAFAYPLLLESFSTTTLVIVAMLVNGYAAGTKLQLCGYLTSRYGGMRNYGAIFGFMSSMIALAAGIGPLLAGITFDLAGNYSVFLICGTAISLISGALVFSLGKYPEWVENDEPTVQSAVSAT